MGSITVERVSDTVLIQAVSIYDRLRPGVRPSQENPLVDVREYVCMLIQKNDVRFISPLF